MSAITEFGRQLASQIIVTNYLPEEIPTDDGAEAISPTQYTYGSSSIDTLNPHFEGGLFKTLCKQMDVEIEDSNKEFSDWRVQNPTLTVTYGQTVDNYAFDGYVITKAEQAKGTSSIKIESSDRMIKTMVAYDGSITFPITVYNLLLAICTKFSFTLGSNAQDVINGSLVIPQDLYTEKDTYRDILDDICEVTGSSIGFGRDGLMYVMYPTASSEVIDYSVSKTIDIGKKYGPINSIVWSRSPQEDNIYTQDEASIASNGLTEVKFANNQIMEAWRIDAEDNDSTTADTAMQAMFAKWSGFYFYLHDITTFGIGSIEYMDEFTIEDGDGNTYKALCLEDNLMVNQGISESFKAREPKQTVTNYVMSSPTAKLIDDTYLRVNKAEGKIEELISVTATKETVDGITETVNSMLSRMDTAESSLLEISQTITSGATSVTTTEGFLFDNTGLHISRSDSDVSSTVDETGLHVVSDGATVLDANNEGVDAINVKVNKYLTIGANSRFEDYNGTRTGCFYIGG